MVRAIFRVMVREREMCVLYFPDDVVTGTLRCPWHSVTHPSERPSLCVCGATAAVDARSGDVTSPRTETSGGGSRLAGRVLFWLLFPC
ncbi:hypothetical protein CDAR_29831 [Caerostris darwini]|uniref:Secreted protein n=1 Tax=Caerostris darwini TaxID=1538125 RepID=A0AAV4QUT7_9ARAC|nr:hypothetical protein CDAR_29831 [Caerostris darwini]